MDLVFPFEEVEVGKTPLPFEQSAAAAADAMDSLDHLLEPASEAGAMLARHVELACGGAFRCEPAALVGVLQRLGYTAKLHQSTASLHSFKHGVRHQFITVCLPDNSSAGLASYIVEPNFRDCFCIAHPTPRFSAVLDGVPTVAVVTKASLHRAVGILAREMAASFAAQGEDLPPWRTAQALLSKWGLNGSPGSSHMHASASGAGATAWAAQGRPAGGDLFAAKLHGMQAA